MCSSRETSADGFPAAFALEFLRADKNETFESPRSFTHLIQNYFDRANCFLNFVSGRALE
jgi:hypothetical protein